MNDIKTYERLFELLPFELQPDDCAINIKKIFQIYASYCDAGDEMVADYETWLDIDIAVGERLDAIGAMHGVNRIKGENDIDYKERILLSIYSSNAATTLPEIQQALSSMADGGNIVAFENYDNLPGNIYLGSTTDIDSLFRAIRIAESILPAGVQIFISISDGGTWQDLLNGFKLWSNVNLDSAKW